MAGQSVVITNTREAIRDGVIPGSFDDDRTTFRFSPLNYVGAKGSMHTWSIYVRLLRGNDYVVISDSMLDSPVIQLADHKAVIIVDASQVGGKIRDSVPTYVSKGKNIGKKNATNPLTQALRDALGLYNKQRRKASTTNNSDMPPPMLAKKINSSSDSTLSDDDFANGITLQRKLDGVHFIAFPHGSELVCYSRGRTKYTEDKNISDELLGMLKFLPKLRIGSFGITENNYAAYSRNVVPYVAGEIYSHGMPLELISGQARRIKKDTNQPPDHFLEFHVFDVFFPEAKNAGHDMESRWRQAYIDDLFRLADVNGVAHPSIKRVENFHPHNEEEMMLMIKRFISEGFEGGIARKDLSGYRYSLNNYHSGNVLKIKFKESSEYKVVGFKQGEKGKDVGAIIWICSASGDTDGETFAVTPNMTYKDRYRLFECLSKVVEMDPSGNPVNLFDKYVKGLPLTVEYAELSVKGVPLQAKGVSFRTYEDGPDKDPMRKIYSLCDVHY